MSNLFASLPDEMVLNVIARLETNTPPNVVHISNWTICRTLETWPTERDRYNRLRYGAGIAYGLFGPSTEEELGGNQSQRDLHL